MSKSRIYLVDTTIGLHVVVKTHRLIRAQTKHQAEQFVCRDQISSRIATQDDLVKHLEDGVEDATEEGSQEEQGNTAMDAMVADQGQAKREGKLMTIPEIMAQACIG